ncbi:MAG: hypothetical protein QOI20_3360 [Acidimicrobiaceae bacterium]|jgi:hypothetical protein|nr:hypothetical protein [Acidimicrobiaceae bacterium]
MARAAVACPVCGKGHRNAQGLGGHLAHSKDQDHTAYRTTGRPPKPAAPPAASGASATQGAQGQAAPEAPAPVMPGDPFSAEGVMWTFDRLNAYLATRRERRRAAQAPAQTPRAQPPTQQATRRAPEPPAPPERLEDFGDAYWRSVLGTGYRPPRKEESDGP